MTVMLNVKELIMDGYSKESPQRRWAREKYPVFTWMMPIYLNRDWVYGKLLLELYGLPKQVPLKAVDSDIRRFLDEKPSARVDRGIRKFSPVPLSYGYCYSDRKSVV